MGFLPKRCGCFTIETAGIMISSKNAVKMLLAIFLHVSYLITQIRFLIAMDIFLHIVILLFAIGILCISLLSIKGIETRNHVFIIPTMIWLPLEVLILFLAWLYTDVSISFLVLGLFCGATDVFGIIVLYCLTKTFREEHKSSPLQQNLQYPEEV